MRSSEYVGMSMSWVCHHLFAHPLFSGVFVFVDTCSPITRTYPQPRVLCMWYCQLVDISIVNFLIGVSDCSGVLTHKPLKRGGGRNEEERGEPLTFLGTHLVLDHTYVHVTERKKTQTLKIFSFAPISMSSTFIDFALVCFFPLRSFLRSIPLCVVYVGRLRGGPRDTIGFYSSLSFPVVFCLCSFLCVYC